MTSPRTSPRLLAALLVLLGALACRGTRPTPSEQASLIVVNAKVTTLDPQRPEASALAVKDGLILATGNDEQVRAFTGPDTRVIDAGGRRLIPGLNDSHNHVIRGGLNYHLELRWDGVRSLRRALDMQKGRLAPGQVADFALLSEDYFTVPEERIRTLESVLTVVEGKPVYGAGEYAGLMPPLPPIRPAWSPVAHFGGYGAPGAPPAP